MFMSAWPLRRRCRSIKPRWNLSMPLFHWSREDPWTLAHSLEGTLVLGATGSGKTSASGRSLALAMLRAGFGGLVLTAKAEEKVLWQSYCRETGRSGDLFVFGPDSPLRFNFLDYELNRPGSGGGLTENIVNLFSTVLEVAERNHGSGGGRDDEHYWRRANRQLARNATDLLALAAGRVSIPDLYRLVISAPTSPTQLCTEEWKRTSFCFQCLQAADHHEKTPRQRHDFGIVADYWLLEFPNLSDKTRSVIVSTFTSMVDVLNRGLLREYFCTETSVIPEWTLAGKVLVIDFPVKEFAELGVFAQVLWKYAWQRAIERRDVGVFPRPVFLWADEAQHFITSYDMMFQTTCRSARIATVLLSQNVSNFYAALGGGDKGRAEADSLFANLNTKIYHANTDPVTNEWAASIIGKTRQFFANGHSSAADDWVSVASGLSPDSHTSAGFSEQMDYEVQPSVFTTLRTGGVAHDRWVDAIVVQNGRLFRETGRTWLPVALRQQG